MRLLLFVLFLALFSPAAEAQTAIVDFSFTCTTTAQVVQPANGTLTYTGLTCWVDGAVPVYFGGPTVTTSTGLPVCEDVACVQMGSGIYRNNVRRGGTGCIVTTGTVAIRCQGPTSR